MRERGPGQSSSSIDGRLDGGGRHVFFPLFFFFARARLARDDDSANCIYPYHYVRIPGKFHTYFNPFPFLCYAARRGGDQTTAANF